MSDKTDETAQQILGIEELGYPVEEYPVWSAGELGELETMPLQNMAKFWLMRKELVIDIEAMMQGLNKPRVHFGDCAYEEIEINALTKLLDKIKELDG